MGQCRCGHTRDVEKNCDGTHKVVKAVREQIAKEIEDSFDPKSSAEIVIAIRNRCAAIARGQK